MGKAVTELLQDLYQRVVGQTLRVAVVGDMILDNEIEGTPGGVHPETKVPVLKDANSHESIGGAANIALALARLGVDVSLFGIIGNDLPGRQMENLLDRQPFADFLIHQRGWPTPRKDWLYRTIEGRPELFQRIDYDRPLPATAREELVGEFRARLPEGTHVVILADHGLGSIGSESVSLVALAKERGCKVVGIPRSTVLRGHALDAIVLNQNEMRRLAQANELADPRPLAARYAREYQQHVYLTMFEEGFVVCPRGWKEPAGVAIERYPLESSQWMGVRDITTTIVALGVALGTDPVGVGLAANVFRHLIATQRGNGKVFWRDAFQFVGLEPPKEDCERLRGTLARSKPTSYS